MSEPSCPSFSDDAHSTRRSAGPVSCPACGSSHLQTKNYAQKFAGIVGASVGVLRALSGGVQFAVSTSALTRISTAVLGAFVEGTLGCVTGAACGQVIDDTILSNYQCLRCHHSFQAT
ncbi:hypothetical protein ACLPHM_16095 [Paenalcaligenes sp. Me131]|uniref:hypothetical protein n=1 Tax=Paenalcaligenes sp. Me131 TaxID=3392636 RepID=UPI003D28B7C3